jgi:guanosine-3',5'-bis(diphosphate) 3'-pyrophosphohydrolase
MSDTLFPADGSPPKPHPKKGGHVPSPAAANAAAASFAALMANLHYLDAASVEHVRQAYRFADEAHLGQLRNSGEPYITHPIAVAAQCAAWKLDAQALMAALLHDAMEDCGVTKPELIERFGAPVAELVDGLTTLDKQHPGRKPGRIVSQNVAGHGPRCTGDLDQAGRPHPQYAHHG